MTENKKNVEELMCGVEVLGHNSLRFDKDGKIIYVDPFRISGTPVPADIIFVTHEHYDHLSEEDIDKLIKPGTMLVLPESCRDAVPEQIACVFFAKPGESYEVDGLRFEAVRAYNPEKAFHPYNRDWLGYLLELEGALYYVAGDTDLTLEAAEVSCDVAFLPVGGTYTMTAEEAAELANTIRPAVAVPVHYGIIVGNDSCAERFKEYLDADIACVIAY